MKDQYKQVPRGLLSRPLFSMGLSLLDHSNPQPGVRATPWRGIREGLMSSNVARQQEIEQYRAAQEAERQRRQFEIEQKQREQALLQEHLQRAEQEKRRAYLDMFAKSGGKPIQVPDDRAPGGFQTITPDQALARSMAPEDYAKEILEQRTSSNSVLAKINPKDWTPESLAAYYASGQDEQSRKLELLKPAPDRFPPHFVPVYLDDGSIGMANSRTGEVVNTGQTGGRYSPETQGRVARAKSKEGAIGAAEGEAEVQLGPYKQQVNFITDRVEELKKHPGKTKYVGTVTGGMQALYPGSDAANFKSRFDQVSGFAFAAAYETLKGAGQITEFEAQTAAKALNRMNRATTVEEFDAALDSFVESVTLGLNKIYAKTGKMPEDWSYEGSE